MTLQFGLAPIPQTSDNLTWKGMQGTKGQGMLLRRLYYILQYWEIRTQSTSVICFHCKWGSYFTKQHCRRTGWAGSYPAIMYLLNGSTLLDNYVWTRKALSYHLDRIHFTFPQHILCSLVYMGPRPREFLPTNSKGLESQQWPEAVTKKILLWWEAHCHYWSHYTCCLKIAIPAVSTESGSQMYCAW